MKKYKIIILIFILLSLFVGAEEQKFKTDENY